MKSTHSVFPYLIYTDGSSRRLGNINLGGWAYIILRDEKIIRSDSGSYINATNQQMELQAAINALDFIKDFRDSNEMVQVFSDSAYLVNCYLQGWYKKWRRNGWVNSKEEEVANKDLWRQLIPFFENTRFCFSHVYGHMGDFWNNKVDLMAREETSKLKTNWRGTEYEREVLQRKSLS